MSRDKSCVRTDCEFKPYGEDEKSLRGRRCWDMGDPCLQHYDNNASALDKVLRGSGNESSGAAYIWRLMIGKEPGKAKPYIIICSTDEQSRNEVKERVDESRIPKNIDFKTHALNFFPSGNIRRIASSFNGPPSNDTPMSLRDVPGQEGEMSVLSQSVIHTSLSAFYDRRQEIRMTGHSIYANADTGLRMATGNAIVNGTDLGYLTVAHVFSSWSQDDSHDDRRGDSLGMISDSDSDTYDAAHDPLNTIPSPASEQQTPEYRSNGGTVEQRADVFATSTAPSGDLPPSSELSCFGEVSAIEEIQNSLDYAVVTIGDLEYRQRLVDLTFPQGSQTTYATAAMPKTSRATALTTHGPIHGMLRASPILMRPSGCKSFHFVYPFEYEGTIQEGDCGSLLLDSVSKELYGMIVAASDRQSIVYIVSAKDVEDQIGKDGWRLLNPDYYYINFPSVVNEPTPINSRIAVSSQTTITSEPQPQSEWNPHFQRYLITLWSAQHGRHYWQHYVEGQGWVFFDWSPVTQEIPQAQPQVQYQPHMRTDSVETITSSGGGPAGYGRGSMVYATYSPTNPHPTSQYETLDPSFNVKGSAFFEEGKVFSILFTEPAGANALNGLNPMADYNTNLSNNTNLSRVRFGEHVHTQVRRFIVVKRKREFCFAVPIFTYYGQATTKPGVEPNEHAIAYSLGQQPQLVQGESPLRKAPIPILMEENNRALVPASRIYFAIHHPIQYNVKVKNLGHVHPDYIPIFLGYWNQENNDSKEESDVAQNPNNTDNF